MEEAESFVANQALEDEAKKYQLPQIDVLYLNEVYLHQTQRYTTMDQVEELMDKITSTGDVNMADFAHQFVVIEIDHDPQPMTDSAKLLHHGCIACVHGIQHVGRRWDLSNPNHCEEIRQIIAACTGHNHARHQARRKYAVISGGNRYRISTIISSNETHRHSQAFQVLRHPENNLFYVPAVRVYSKDLSLSVAGYLMRKFNFKSKAFIDHSDIHTVTALTTVVRNIEDSTQYIFPGTTRLDRKKVKSLPPGAVPHFGTLNAGISRDKASSFVETYLMLAHRGLGLFRKLTDSAPKCRVADNWIICACAALAIVDVTRAKHSNEFDRRETRNFLESHAGRQWNDLKSAMEAVNPEAVAKFRDAVRMSASVVFQFLSITLYYILTFGSNECTSANKSSSLFSSSQQTTATLIFRTIVTLFKRSGDPKETQHRYALAARAFTSWISVSFNVA